MNTISNNTSNEVLQNISVKDILRLSKKDEKQLLYYLTDEQWQEIFQQLKDINVPSTDKFLSRKCVNQRVMQRRWILTDSEGLKTTDEFHCDVINDTLRVIRKKYKTKVSIDHVYYIKNIVELLRFEPEMQSRLVHDDGDGFTYIEVWLDREV